MRFLLVVCFAVAVAGGAYVITAPNDTIAQGCVQTNTCP
jgi:hypothetical protein